MYSVIFITHIVRELIQTQEYLLAKIELGHYKGKR